MAFPTTLEGVEALLDSMVAQGASNAEKQAVIDHFTRQQAPLASAVSQQIGKVQETQSKMASLPESQQKQIEDLVSVSKVPKQEYIDAFLEKNRKFEEGQMGAVAAAGIEQGVQDIKKGAGDIKEAVSGEDISAGDRALKAGSGLIDIASGTAGTIFSAPAAVISEVPVVGPAVEETFGFIDEKSRDAAVQFGNLLGIDPESEQGQALQKGFGLVGQLVAAKTVPKVAKPVVEKVKPSISRLGKGVTDGIVKVQETFKKTPVTEAKVQTLSVATGLKPEVIKTIAEYPEQFGKVQEGVITRETLADSVAKGINKRSLEISETGKAYETIRQSGESIQMPTSAINNLLEKKGFTLKDGILTEKGKLSTPLSEADLIAVRKAYELIKDSNSLTAAEVLNLRQKLDSLINYKTDVSPKGQKLVKEMRFEVDKVAKENIKGLKDLDSQFSGEIAELNKIKREFFTKEGELKPSFLNQMVNLTKEGKQNKLALLEKVQPGITQDLLALKAFESITGKGPSLGRVLTGVVATPGSIVGPVIGAMASQPTIAVQLVKLAFKDSTASKPLITKIKAQEPFTVAESKMFVDAVKQAMPEMIPYIDQEITIEGADTEQQEI